ncbi:MAG: hypothetical protein AABX52_03380 [Nanoarchaeota archaeon]
MQGLSKNPFSRPHIEIHKPAWKRMLEKSSVQLLIALLVVMFGIIIFKYLGQHQGPQLILNTLILHKGQLDVIKRSTLITQTDDIVRSTDNRKIINQWKSLSACVPTTCPDAEYFNFIITVTEEENIPHNDLILNLIRTYKYWNSPDDILDFSKALTDVNNEVDTIGSREVTKAWAEIVKCNGKCENVNMLYFDMIKAVVLESSAEE